VRARKYKEETEERQRRAAAAASSSTAGVPPPGLELAAHYAHQAPPAHSYHHHGASLNGTPHKVERKHTEQAKNITLKPTISKALIGLSVGIALCPADPPGCIPLAVHDND